MMQPTCPFRFEVENLLHPKSSPKKTPTASALIPKQYDDRCALGIIADIIQMSRAMLRFLYFYKKL